jgi:2-polyprenyl-3-methyl-5-hydroxy-6-metoxy-1,4-benzoquinol methylase
MRSSATLERLLLNSGRLGATDVFHENIRRRGVFGQLYLLLFGTPHLGSFANGYYLRETLAGIRPTSVLDAGCGDGTFTVYVARRLPEASVLGVDIGEQGLHSSETTLDICRRVQQRLALPNVRFQQMDLRELNLPGAFDFVYSFDVLEHIAENRLVLENIFRSLRAGGHFLIRIPARVQKRVLNEKYTADHAYWASKEHLGQHYDMPSLVADLKAIGYDIVWSRYTTGAWGRLSFEGPEMLRYYGVPEPLFFAAIPLFKALRYIDTRCRPSEGDGLLVFCRKPERR